MSSRTLVSLGVAGLTLGTSFAQGIVLKWKPKVGEKAVYKTKAVTEFALVDHLELKGAFTEETLSVDGVRVVMSSRGA